MKPSAFKQWRKELGLSQKQAAEALGLKRRVVQYYEKGERDGDKVEVPLSVRLACFALASGIADYHGLSHPPIPLADKFKVKKAKEKGADKNKDRIEGAVETDRSAIEAIDTPNTEALTVEEDLPTGAGAEMANIGGETGPNGLPPTLHTPVTAQV